jgi:transcriptional regulator with XRE-family HTH domain
MTKPTATALDAQIGKRIRIRRRQLGMSQTDLAEKIGVAFQQVQKYENGTNRVPASRLPYVAGALDVHMGYFYSHDDAAAGVDTAVVADSIGLLAERHAIELLECFQAMTASQRNALLEIARALAAANAITEPASPAAELGKATRLRKASSPRAVAVRAFADT